MNDRRVDKQLKAVTSGKRKVINISSTRKRQKEGGHKWRTERNEGTNTLSEHRKGKEREVNAIRKQACESGMNRIREDWAGVKQVATNT